MQAMKRKDVQLRLTPFDFEKLEEMKEAGFIKNYARFCEKAVEKELEKKYKAFQEEISKKEAITS